MRRCSAALKQISHHRTVRPFSAVLSLCPCSSIAIVLAAFCCFVPAIVGEYQADYSCPVLMCGRLPGWLGVLKLHVTGFGARKHPPRFRLLSHDAQFYSGSKVDRNNMTLSRQPSFSGVLPRKPRFPPLQLHDGSSLFVANPSVSPHWSPEQRPHSSLPAVVGLSIGCQLPPAELHL